MTLPTLDQAEELPGPFEILELADGETKTFGVSSWEIGKMLIHPRDGRDAKWVVGLRVHVRAGEKATLPDYWDVTAQHLVAGLLPYLEQPGYPQKVFTVTKRGDGARARFTLEVVPAGPK